MTVCTPHRYAGPQACPYCRIAELEKAAESHAFVVASWKREEEAWAEREQQIARALVELVQHARPLCSEDGAIEYAIDRVLAILNGEP